MIHLISIAVFACTLDHCIQVLPIAAFYDPQSSVSVNTLAELASHKNHRVRLRCCKMLSYFLIYLPDRYDHQQRLLPYVLSFIHDDSNVGMSEVQEEALQCIEKCGLQYEDEHPDEVIERRQFGVDGEDTIDYNNSSNLPQPFTARPSLGARLFVRANCSRFFLAMLNELSHWRDETRKRSAELLLILTVYCEEHLTKDFQHTLKSIAKAISVEKSSSQAGNSTVILDTINKVLRLMATYVDPSAYLPLVCPRVCGDNASATSNSEDGSHSERTRSNYAIILSSLIEGTPLHRLLPHWIRLASLLSNCDCIGSFVGTQARHDSLTALIAHIEKVSSQGDVERFISYFADKGNMAEFQSVLSSSAQALTDLFPTDTADCTDAAIRDDAKKVQECLASIEKLKIATTQSLL